MINSSPLPLVYQNRIVEHLIGDGEELGVGWLVGPRCHWYIITGVEHLIGGGGTGMINSSLLPLVYNNRIVEHLIGEGGGGGIGMISSSPLPLLYHNRIVEHLMGGGGVISSSPLPLLYHNRRIEHLIGEGGEWGD